MKQYKMNLPCPLLIIVVLLLFVFGSCSRGSYENKKDESDMLADTINFLTSGDTKMDSMIQLTISMPQDTTLAIQYYKIAEMYEDYDFEKASAYYLKMGYLCEQLEWHTGIYLFTIGYSHILTRQGWVDSAIVVNKKAYNLAKEEKNELYTGKLAYSTANAYFMKQWHEMALTFYMEALAVFEKMSDRERLGSIYNQLCQIYSDNDAVEKAIEFGEKAVMLCIDDPYSLIGLAKAYTLNNQLKKANEHLELALQICTKQNNIYLTGVIYYHLSENILKDFDLDKAEKYAKKALDINKKIGNKAAYSGALSVLSKVEELRGNFAQAEAYIKEVMQIVTEIENLPGKNFCYVILSELSIAQEKYRDNVRYWKEWDVVKNEIASETTLRVAAEMEAKYEIAKKEMEIERQQLIISRQNIQRNFFSAGIVVCVALIGLLWYMYWLRARKNRALEELNTTKDRFFSIISHDLKNPVLAQRDAIQLMLKNASSWDTNTLADYYDKLMKSADGQVELLYNLLGWAQIQTGRMTYTPVTCDLSVRLRADITLISKMAESKGIAFSFQLTDAAPITGDCNMLATVVRNLLTNAVKFTPVGGQVSMSIVSSPSGKQLVTICDSGTGMTAEQVCNLFRLDCPQSRRGTDGETGSGLGLIVCKELLEKHGSMLHVESEEGKGSRFWFEI